MDYDVIVVGLGAMGSAAAYHLARRGRRVLGLDAFTLGHSRGSSHGETRIIRLSYFEHPDYVPLLRRAYDLWGALESEAGTRLLHLTGGLYVGRPESALIAGSLLSARRYRLAHELLDAAEVSRRYPVFRPAAGDVAVYETQAGVLFPERCIAAHCRLAAQAGAHLRFEQPVRRWSVTADGVEVQTETATYRARRLVLTAGAWLGPLLGKLPGGGGQPPPLRVERNVTFWIEPRESPHLFEADRFPIFIWDSVEAGTFYGLPHVERPGVKVARHHSGQFCDPKSVNREVTAEDEAPVRQFIRHAIPPLDGPTHFSLTCLYTNTPDGHFVVDRHPDHEAVVFAGGGSGHAFKFASVIGELVADLAIEGQATPDAAFLGVSRLFRQDDA